MDGRLPAPAGTRPPPCYRWPLAGVGCETPHRGGGDHKGEREKRTPASAPGPAQAPPAAPPPPPHPTPPPHTPRHRHHRHTRPHGPRRAAPSTRARAERGHPALGGRGRGVRGRRRARLRAHAGRPHNDPGRRSAPGAQRRRRLGARDPGAAAALTPRAAEVLRRIRSIPEGRVTTYGDLSPGAPRFAGSVLSANHDPDLPWYRVVRADGSLAKGDRQRRLLEREGVPMRGNRVDMAAAWWPPEG